MNKLNRGKGREFFNHVNKKVMQQKINSIRLSYYGLTLLAYLKESHPNLVDDSVFINTRADEASEVYSNTIKQGSSHLEAEEFANQSLYKDLLFSKTDMLIHILWNEFSSIVPQSKAKDYALELLAKCEFIFVQYALDDEFSYSDEYAKLYTELTGFIDLWLKEYELQ